jgi:cation:H+ antiporter
MTYSFVFNTDVTILIAGTIGLFIAMFTGVKKKLDRWEAAIFVIFFVSYIVLLVR